MAKIVSPRRGVGKKRGRECPVEKLDETKDPDVVGHGHGSQFASACVIGVRRERGTLMLFGP